jgi:hypothetical protein
LGILSSQVHVLWMLRAGSTLEDRPLWINSTCFLPFPFADADTGLTSELAQRIRVLAEKLDSHRKGRQAAHPGVTLTGMYNVLGKLRTGEPLTATERTLHDQGLVGVLKTLHDDLDAAVLAAYGWTDLRLPADSEVLLERLVALNQVRAEAEAAGTVHWLRPGFQQKAEKVEQVALEPATEVPETSEPAPMADSITRTDQGRCGSPHRSKQTHGHGDDRRTFLRAGPLA